MSNTLYLQLGWLSKPSPDFATAIKSIPTAGADTGTVLRQLAQSGLNELQLSKLARAFTKARDGGADMQPLIPLKVAVLSNATTEFLCPALVATGLRHGFAIDLVAAPYGQVAQEVLDPASMTYAADPDVIIFALDHRGINLTATPGDERAAKAGLAAALQQIETYKTAILKHSGAVGMFQTVARPAEPDLGSLDLAVAGTWRQLTHDFNRALAEMLNGTPHLLLDTAGLAETVGLATWHDPGLWQMARVPHSNLVLPLYADHVLRVISAWRGQSRRCLVLDLDNTLWGGVIGDDGLDGIRLAEGDAVGEAHRAVQECALQLRDRGIVLAVSSKNDDDVARSAFREHSEMVLKEDHIAVFQANWRDKATNIQAISDALSLGLESLAFLDDNPAERGLVREALGKVAVPELSDDPAYFVRILMASGFFEASTFSDEDRRRAEDYQSNSKRVALQASVTDIEDYLRSLEMEFSLQPFDTQGRSRIAQLINKSNQFNLTTRRYSEADVAKMEGDSDIMTLQVRLKDRFADNGMISVLICRTEGSIWEIDTWLMSCRVLGRRVEKVLLQFLKTAAQAAGITTLRGRYIPSTRNSMVAEHYAQLGFTFVETHDDGTTVWSVEIADIPTCP
jgi:FkbH-like protein